MAKKIRAHRCQAEKTFSFSISRRDVPTGNVFFPLSVLTGAAVDKREAYEVSLAEVSDAFAEELKRRQTAACDALEYVRAQRRYQIALLRWKSDYLSLAAEGVRRRVPGLGHGQALVVLHEGEEHVARSVYVLSRVYGFKSSYISCADAREARAPGNVDLVLLDADIQVTKKASTVGLLRKLNPDCRVVVLSRKQRSSGFGIAANLIISRPSSALQIFECITKVSGQAPPVQPEDLGECQITRASDCETRTDSYGTARGASNFQQSQGMMALPSRHEGGPLIVLPMENVKADVPSPLVPGSQSCVSQSRRLPQELS